MVEPTSTFRFFISLSGLTAEAIFPSNNLISSHRKPCNRSTPEQKSRVRDLSSKLTTRFIIFSLTLLFCQASGELRPARASGCHASDRPILSHHHSWDDHARAGHLDQSTNPSVGLSQAVRTIPCQSESPVVLKSPFPASLFVPWGYVDRFPLCLTTLPHPMSDPSHLSLAQARLERPPR